MAGDIDSLQIEIGASSSDATEKINALIDALKELKDLTNQKWKNPFEDFNAGLPTGKGGGGGGNGGGTGDPLSEDLQERIANADKLEVAFKRIEMAQQAMQDAFDKGNANAAWKARDKELSEMDRYARLVEKLTEMPPIPDPLANAVRNADKIDILREKIERYRLAMEEALKGGDLEKAYAFREKMLNAQGMFDRESAKAHPIEVPLNDALQERIRNANQIDILTEKVNRYREAMEAAMKAGDRDKAFSMRGQMLQAENALEKARAAAQPTQTTPLDEGLANLIRNANQIDILTAKVERYRIAMEEAIRAGNQDKAYSARNSMLQAAAALEKARNAASGAAKGIKDVSKEASKSTGPLGNFISSLKRIAFYRIIRAIIRSITQAFKEGFKNAYDYSKMYGLELANTMDTIKTKSLTMKNQLGAALGGLVTALAPVALQLISIVTAIANAITRLFAILNGQNTWMRAKDVWTEWGDAAQSAGGAAKEALKYLAPFDEINRLPDDKGGGGGGGSNTPNVADMFETVSTDIGSGLVDTITGALEKLKKFFLDHDWQGLGESAWESLKTAFSDIGKGTELVETFFGTLGAALGAGASFIWGFAKSAVEELFLAFKENIVDYDGDNAITSLDIFIAAFRTYGEAKKDMYEWIGEHVVTPFMESLIDAFDSSENNEKSKELGKNIMKGITLGMQLFTDGEGKFTLEKLFNIIIEIAKSVFQVKEGSPAARMEWLGRDIIQGLLNGISAKWRELTDKVEELWNKLSEWWDGLSLKEFHIPRPRFEWTYEQASGIVARALEFVGLPPTIPHLNISWYAKGGFPEDGLFMANHGELVGKFSNGKTAVANNEQITSGIAEAVYDAFMSAFAVTGGNGNNDREIAIYLDGKEIARTTTKYQQQMARAAG